MTTSGLLAKIFLHLIIESHRWYSRLYLPHFEVCVLIICWELHNQAHGIPPNEHSWSACYVVVNIQLMQAPCNLPLCGLRFLGPCYRLQTPSICFFKILRWWYLVSSVWSWAVMIKLSVSPLTKHNLLLLSTKGFSRLQKIVHALMHWCIGFSRSSSILSFYRLSFSITFSGVWAVDKSKYLFFNAFACLRREYFAFPRLMLFYKPAQYNHSNWPCTSSPYLH